MPEEPSLRQQAKASILFIHQLTAENESLRRKVEQLEQQIQILRSSGQTLLGPETTKAWMKALEAVDPKAWRELTVGTFSWNASEGYPDGGGLCALVQELLSSPGTDERERRSWNHRFPAGHHLHDQFPRRFLNQDTVSWHLRVVGQGGLANTLDALTTGLTFRSKAVRVVEACFLLYGTDAVQMLQSDPGTVLRRLREEVAQATSFATAASWKLLTELLSGRASQAQALRTLGLEPGADADAIKAAYRAKARQHHPDAGGDADQFHKVTRAYELLTA